MLYKAEHCVLDCIQLSKADPFHYQSHLDDHARTKSELPSNFKLSNKNNY